MNFTCDCKLESAASCICERQSRTRRRCHVRRFCDSQQLHSAHSARQHMRCRTASRCCYGMCVVRTGSTTRSPGRRPVARFCTGASGGGGTHYLAPSEHQCLPSNAAENTCRNHIVSVQHGRSGAPAVRHLCGCCMHGHVTSNHNLGVIGVG